MKEFDLSTFKKVTTINLLSNGNDRHVFQNVFSSDWKKLEYSIPEESELNGSVSQEFPHLSELTEQFPHLDGVNFGEWIDTLFKNGKGNILHYGRTNEWTIAKDIIDKFGTGIRNYTTYDVVKLEEEREGIHSWQANYHRKEGTSNDFDPDKIGRNTFDIAFAKNISARTEKQFDLIKKLYAVTAQDGLLFVHGIVLEKQVATNLVSKWQELGYQFAFNIDSPFDFKSGNLTILNIAMRKTTDSLFAPQSLGKLIRIRIGTFLVD